MRRDIDDPMCQRDCHICPLQGVTPRDCPGDCLDCPYSRFCPCGNRFIYPQLAQLASSTSHILGAWEVPIGSIRQDMLPHPPIANYDSAMVRILGRIFQLIGQRKPLVLAPHNTARQQCYRLVGGLDVLLAAKALGWKHVLAHIVELSQYEASVQFYRCELQRLDLSWENQARCLLALRNVYRRRYHCWPCLATLGTLSGLTKSRTRDLLHGVALLKRHGISDGTIPFPTLLRSVRATYPEAVQRDLIHGLVEGGWTRRRATSYAKGRMQERTSDVLGKARRPNIHFVPTGEHNLPADSILGEPIYSTRGSGSRLGTGG